MPNVRYNKKRTKSTKKKKKTGTNFQTENERTSSDTRVATFNLLTNAGEYFMLVTV